MDDGDEIFVTNSGISGSGIIRVVSSHGLTSTRGLIVVIDANTYWERSDLGVRQLSWWEVRYNTSHDDGDYNKQAFVEAIERDIANTIPVEVDLGEGEIYFGDNILPWGSYRILRGRGRFKTIFRFNHSSSGTDTDNAIVHDQFNQFYDMSMIQDGTNTDDSGAFVSNAGTGDGANGSANCT